MSRFSYIIEHFTFTSAIVSVGTTSTLYYWERWLEVAMEFGDRIFISIALFFRYFYKCLNLFLAYYYQSKQMDVNFLSKFVPLLNIISLSPFTEY